MDDLFANATSSVKGGVTPFPPQLKELGGQLVEEAAATDAAVDQVHAGLAQQLAAVDPGEAANVLSALGDVLELMGSPLQGDPKGLGDPAVTRALSAVADAAEDAAAADVISPEAVFSIDEVLASPAMVAGKLGMLAGSREFRHWLKQPAAKGEQPQAATAKTAKEPAADTEDDDLALLKGRA